jgi:hypothetical protein
MRLSPQRLVERKGRMKIQKEHRMNISASRYFELMFDPVWDKRMNLEGMHIQSWELLERHVDGPAWSMRCKVTPQDNMPGFIKKLVGGSFLYEEKRLHTKGSDSATGEMTPNVMRDKLRMGYRIRLVPDGENACKRIMEWEVEVKIFGLGGQIEKFALGEIEKGTDASARFFNQHAAQYSAAT